MIVAFEAVALISFRYRELMVLMISSSDVMSIIMVVVVIVPFTNTELATELLMARALPDTAPIKGVVARVDREVKTKQIDRHVNKCNDHMQGALRKKEIGKMPRRTIISLKQGRFSLCR